MTLSGCCSGWAWGSRGTGAPSRVVQIETDGEEERLRLRHRGVPAAPHEGPGTETKWKRTWGNEPCAPQVEGAVWDAERSFPQHPHPRLRRGTNRTRKRTFPGAAMRPDECQRTPHRFLSGPCGESGLDSGPSSSPLATRELAP